MAQVKAFKVKGIRMIIHSGDHEPPHFHASKPGHWYTKVYIEESPENMIALQRPSDARITKSDRKAITEGVEKNRYALLKEWETCQG